MKTESFDQLALHEALQSRSSSCTQMSYQEALEQYNQIKSTLSNQSVSPQSSNRSQRSKGILLGNPILRYRAELDKPIDLGIPQNVHSSAMQESYYNVSPITSQCQSSRASLSSLNFYTNKNIRLVAEGNISNGANNLARNNINLNRITAENYIFPNSSKKVESGQEYLDNIITDLSDAFENELPKIKLNTKNIVQKNIQVPEAYTPLSNLSTNTSHGSNKKTEYWLWDTFAKKYNRIDKKNANLLQKTSRVASHTFHLPVSPLLTPNGLLKSVNSLKTNSEAHNNSQNKPEKIEHTSNENQIIKKKCDIIRGKLSQDKRKNINTCKPKLPFPHEETPLKDRGRLVVRNQEDFDKISFILGEEGGEFPFLITNSGMIKHDPVGRGARYREIWSRDRFLNREKKFSFPRFFNEL